MNIKKEIIETSHGPVARFTITNSSGAKVTVSEIGAGIVAVEVPDRDGRLEDVTIGYADPDNYFGDGPGAGKTPGRYANRIARGLFTLDGKEFHLPVNLPPNHLHGGDNGFHHRRWLGEVSGGNSVCFTLHSPDGDAGYPGNLTVKVTYRWDEDCTLRIDYQATTDAPTVINLTNHAYWNLAGHSAGPAAALAHELTLFMNSFLETDGDLTPTGRLLPVAGTPMDFSTPRPVGRELHADYTPLRHAKGYDHCWAFDSEPRPGELQRAAVLHDPASGRSLTVLTDQPGIQVYTGNWLTGSPAGKDGAVYTDYCAIALECQGFPDAPNHPEFPSQRLDPADIYHRTIVYAFSSR